MTTENNTMKVNFDGLKRNENFKKYLKLKTLINSLSPWIQAIVIDQ